MKFSFENLSCLTQLIQYSKTYLFPSKIIPFPSLPTQQKKRTTFSYGFIFLILYFNIYYCITVITIHFLSLIFNCCFFNWNILMWSTFHNCTCKGRLSPFWQEDFTHVLRSICGSYSSPLMSCCLRNNTFPMRSKEKPKWY